MTPPAKTSQLFSCLLAVMLLVWAPSRPAWAQGATEVEQEASGTKPPLAPLPKPPSRRFATPKPADLKLLDQVLSRIRQVRKPDVRAALDELLDVDASLLPAIRRRIDIEADGADRARMKRLLLDIRQVARDDIQKQMRARGDKGEVVTPDYLEMVLSYPQLEHKSFETLTNVLALSRLCVRLGNVRAVRALIHVYVRFAFLRIDTQLQLQKLGQRALPALIEATRHPAPQVSGWARRRLDFFGKAIPSEAVTVDDPLVLADILRAYGWLKDPDAARLVISFANSERAQVRLAARQAVTSFGEIGNWQLRDTYEQMVGKKPPRDWSWDRTAKELFREFDLIRLAEVYGLYDEGLKAKQAGNLDGMRAAFDRVLARDPDFEKKTEMVEGYLAYAEQQLKQAGSDKSQPNGAQELNTVAAALQRAARLSTSDAERNQAQSLQLTLEAKRLFDQGLADQTLLRRALKLNENNELARELLSEAEQRPLAETGSFMRFLWPSLLGGLSIILALLVVIRRPRKPEDAVVTEADSVEDTASPKNTEATADNGDGSNGEVTRGDSKKDEPPAEIS